MDIPLVPYNPPSISKKYTFKKKMKKSQYGQWKNQWSFAVPHHQGVEDHHPLPSDVLSDPLLPNKYPSQTPNKSRSDDNWRTTLAVLSWKILFRVKLSRGFLLRKFLYKKWPKRWLQKRRLVMPIPEYSMLSTRQERRNMRPIFSYRMKRRSLMILWRIHSLWCKSPM